MHMKSMILFMINCHKPELKPGMLILVLVLVLKDSLRTFFKSLSLSWSLGVRSLSLSWSLGVRSLSLSLRTPYGHFSSPCPSPGPWGSGPCPCPGPWGTGPCPCPGPCGSGPCPYPGPCGLVLVLVLVFSLCKDLFPLFHYSDLNVTSAFTK